MPATGEDTAQQGNQRNSCANHEPLLLIGKPAWQGTALRFLELLGQALIVLAQPAQLRTLAGGIGSLQLFVQLFAQAFAFLQALLQLGDLAAGTQGQGR